MQHHYGNKPKLLGFLNLMRFKCPRAPAFRGRSNVRVCRGTDSVSQAKERKCLERGFPLEVKQVKLVVKRQL